MNCFDICKVEGKQKVLSAARETATLEYELVGLKLHPSGTGNDHDVIQLDIVNTL